jgi:UDP-N-acetylglucosamine acyltransferase
VTTIHPTAIVDPRAEIGDHGEIGPYSVIEGDVVVGEGCTVGPHVYIANGARIGNQVAIHKGAVVATLPQDLKFGGEKTLFEIGDHTVVREFCTLNRGTAAHGKSRVGSNCLLMAYAHVAHDCTVGDHVILANAVQIGGHVTIEDWAILGGMAAVHQFVHVGQHSMIGGTFRAIKDVPPYILASGEPLRYSGLNSVGLRRRGFQSETLSTLKKVYRLLYRSQLNVSQAVERIRQELEITEPVQNILTFIENADRGII